MTTAVSAPIERLYQKNGKTKSRWGLGRDGDPTVIVLHYDATFSAIDTHRILTNRGISVHKTLERDGVFHEHVAEENRCWHAGYGSWLGKTNLNHVSLGVEITNIGQMEGIYEESMGRGYRSTREVVPDFDGNEYYRNEGYKDKNGVQKTTLVITKQPCTAVFPDHREGFKGAFWARYSDPGQAQSIALQCVEWADKYGILPENIVGHEIVTPQTSVRLVRLLHSSASCPSRHRAASPSDRSTAPCRNVSLPHDNPELRERARLPCDPWHHQPADVQDQPMTREIKGLVPNDTKRHCCRQPPWVNLITLTRADYALNVLDCAIQRWDSQHLRHCVS